MTKITKTLQLALVLAMVGGAMAIAQEVSPDPGVPDTSVNVKPVIKLAGLELRVGGVDLQTNVAMNVAYQVKDDLFAGAEKFSQGATEVTEINLDPSTMGLIGRSHGRDGEEARKMKTMVIHTYKYDKPGMYRMEDVDAYRKKLEDGSWHCAIHVRSTTGSTDICSRTGADKETNEMVILTAEPRELTFIHMSGKMSLDELDDMTGTASRFRPNLPTPPKPPKPPKEKGMAPMAPMAPVPPAPPAPPQ
jgi:hypothetical protein